jgi:tight adherence protein C
MLSLILAIALTVFLGVALLLLLLGGKSAIVTRLTEVATVDGGVHDEERGPGEPSQALAKALGVLAPIRKMLGMTADSDVTRRLSLAGFREPVHTDLFFGIKLLAPVFLAAVAAFFIRENTIFWFFALAALGFFGPELWLGRAITQRREKVRLSLPDALDLLVICMEAGLGMDQALIRVGQELRISHPELSEEFLLINLEQRAGKPRVDAWRNMADRTGLEVVRAFVNMLVQTERFGTPISRSLGHFADALRLKRRQQAEEQAAKTTIKMIFPLVLFIFPSMFIVLLAPAVISIGKTLDSVFK